MMDKVISKWQTHEVERHEERYRREYRFSDSSKHSIQNLRGEKQCNSPSQLSFYLTSVLLPITERVDEHSVHGHMKKFLTVCTASNISKLSTVTMVFETSSMMGSLLVKMEANVYRKM